jgi:hypothetical protein
MAETINLTFVFAVDKSKYGKMVDNRTTLKEVRNVWATKTGRDPASFFFFTKYGPLPEEGTLLDVVKRDADHLRINVDALGELVLSCFGLPSLTWCVRLGVDTTAAEVVAAARKRLRVPAANKMRLLLKGRALAPNVKIRSESEERVVWAQVDVQMFVRLAMFRPTQFYEPAFEDEELVSDTASAIVPALEKGLDDLPLLAKGYLSDPVALLMVGDTALNCQRLLSADLERSAYAEFLLADIVTVKDIGRGQVTFFLELSMTLFVNYRQFGTTQEMRVWPSEPIYLIWTDEDESLLFNGKRFSNGSASFVECGVCDGARVEVVEVMGVKVRDSRGRLHKLQVDKDMPFPEFKLRLRDLERQRKFFVKIGPTTIFDSTATLWQLGVRDRMELEVVWTTSSVRIVHGDEETTVHDVDSTWRFHDFLVACREAFGPTVAADARLVCLCGRVMSATQDPRWEEPLGCCCCRLLHLEVAVTTAIEASDTFRHVSCRLPPRTPQAVFRRIRKLVETKGSKERRLQERLLVACVLDLLQAKDVSFCLSKKIDFSIELTNGRLLEWTAAPSTRLSEVLAALVDLNHERQVDDFSGRHRVFFGANELGTTLKRAPVANGQVLKVEAPPRPGEHGPLFSPCCCCCCLEQELSDGDLPLSQRTPSPLQSDSRRRCLGT